MKKLFTKNFWKEDWKKTRGWDLWNIFFTAWMLAVIFNSVVRGLYLHDVDYFTMAIWQTGYLMLWCLLAMKDKTIKMWRDLCNDIQDFNRELIDDKEKMIKKLEELIKK